MGLCPIKCTFNHHAGKEHQWCFIVLSHAAYDLLFLFFLSVKVTITLLNFIELMCYVLLKDLNLFEVCSFRFFLLFALLYITWQHWYSRCRCWGSMTFITFSNHINDNVLVLNIHFIHIAGCLFQLMLHSQLILLFFDTRNEIN